MPAKAKHTVPPVGTRFKRRYKGKVYTLIVIEQDGQTLYMVGGKAFRAPSAAAKSITRTEINGWIFWGIH